MRRLYGYAFLVMFAMASGVDLAEAAPGVSIIPETSAARHGLTRPWFTQVQVDQTRSKISHVILHDGTLFVQTEQAILQAIDAETGRTLWVTEVGRRNHPSMRPSVSGDMVAVINGSYLYILNRYTGKLLWQREVEGAPGAGPALSEIRAYVPLTSGLVLAYRLEAIPDPAIEMGLYDSQSEEDVEALKKRRREGMRLQQELKPPLACQSFGRALVQPLITRENAGEEYVAWPTDRGYLFVGRIDRKTENFFEMRYKLETAADITADPTFLPAAIGDASESGIIFAPSRDGFLHAIREKDGSSLWRFSTGEPMVEPAAPIADKVYATTQLGGMYCLASNTGEQLWWTPDIMRFVAAGNGRVYVEDRYGNLVVLLAETGQRIDVISAVGLPIKLMNLQTDRIYLASETGLLQCLREVESEQPILHLPKPAPKQVVTEPNNTVPEATPQPEPEPAPAANPFGAGGGAANPFGAGDAAGDADPFGGGAAPAEDPFGGGAGGNPFGGGAGAAPADDPFGGGAATVDDPFS